MAMRLRITMYDDSPDASEGFAPGIRISVSTAVEQRLVQEEVWVQTAWPEGETPIEELFRPATAGSDIDDRLHHALQALGGIRHRLSVGEIGQQQAWNAIQEYVRNAFGSYGGRQEL